MPSTASAAHRASGQIAATLGLMQRPQRLDSISLYVSDHGESLGQQGLFLHGVPYAFAPSAQTPMPMLLSHDNVYHTVLGALQITNAAHDGRLMCSLDIARRSARE